MLSFSIFLNDKLYNRGYQDYNGVYEVSILVEILSNLSGGTVLCLLRMTGSLAPKSLEASGVGAMLHAFCTEFVFTTSLPFS